MTEPPKDTPKPPAKPPKIEVKPSKPKGLQIGWKDGLPDDELERAQIEQILKTTGLTSLYSSLKRRLDGDDDAVQEELERIEEERSVQQQSDIAMAQALAPPDPGAAAETQSKANQAKMNAERGRSGTASESSGNTKPGSK